MDARMAQTKSRVSANHKVNRKVSVKVKDSHAEMVASKTQAAKARAEVAKDDRMALMLREEVAAKLHRLHSLRTHKMLDAVLGRPKRGVFVLYIF